MLGRDPLVQAEGRRRDGVLDQVWLAEVVVLGGEAVEAVGLRRRDGSIAVVGVGALVDGTVLVDCGVVVGGGGVRAGRLLDSGLQKR